MPCLCFLELLLVVLRQLGKRLRKLDEEPRLPLGHQQTKLLDKDAHVDLRQRLVRGVEAAGELDFGHDLLEDVAALALDDREDAHVVELHGGAVDEAPLGLLDLLERVPDNDVAELDADAVNAAHVDGDEDGGRLDADVVLHVWCRLLRLLRLLFWGGFRRVLRLAGSLERGAAPGTTVGARRLRVLGVLAVVAAGLLDPLGLRDALLVPLGARARAGARRGAFRFYELALRVGRAFVVVGSGLPLALLGAGGVRRGLATLPRLAASRLVLRVAAVVVGRGARGAQGCLAGLPLQAAVAERRRGADLGVRAVAEPLLLEVVLRARRRGGELDAPSRPRLLALLAARRLAPSAPQFLLPTVLALLRRGEHRLQRVGERQSVVQQVHQVAVAHVHLERVEDRADVHVDVGVVAGALLEARERHLDDVGDALVAQRDDRLVPLELARLLLRVEHLDLLELGPRGQVPVGLDLHLRPDAGDRRRGEHLLRLDEPDTHAPEPKVDVDLDDVVGALLGALLRLEERRGERGRRHRRRRLGTRRVGGRLLGARRLVRGRRELEEQGEEGEDGLRDDAHGDAPEPQPDADVLPGVRGRAAVDDGDVRRDKVLVRLKCAGFEDVLVRGAADLVDELDRPECRRGGHVPRVLDVLRGDGRDDKLDDVGDLPLLLLAAQADGDGLDGEVSHDLTAGEKQVLDLFLARDRLPVDLVRRLLLFLRSIEWAGEVRRMRTT